MRLPLSRGGWIFCFEILVRTSLQSQRSTQNNRFTSFISLHPAPSLDEQPEEQNPFLHRIRNKSAFLPGILREQTVSCKASFKSSLQRLRKLKTTKKLGLIMHSKKEMNKKTRSVLFKKNRGKCKPVKMFQHTTVGRVVLFVFNAMATS